MEILSNDDDDNYTKLSLLTYQKLTLLKRLALVMINKKLE